MNILEEIAAKTTERIRKEKGSDSSFHPPAPLRRKGGPEPRNFSLRKL